MTPCHSCHAGCCRAFAVPVSGADIIKIQRLGVPFSEFVCRWPDIEGKIARNHAPHFRFIDDVATPYVICLTHTKSRFFAETTKCKFLLETPPDAEHPLGGAQCEIYNDRPGTCRSFPAKLNETGELAVLHDVPQNGRSNEHEIYNLCPRRWEPEDLDPIDTVQALVLAKFEMLFFGQVARIWNRTPRSWNLFADFLQLVYAGRVIQEPAADEAEEEPRILPMKPARTFGRTRAA